MESIRAGFYLCFFVCGCCLALVEFCVDHITKGIYVGLIRKIMVCDQDVLDDLETL